MMKRVLSEGLLTVLIFFAVLIVFSKVDWVRLFKVEQVTNQTEQKLGEVFWKVFKKSGNECSDELVLGAVDTIVTRLCKANDIDRKTIKVHVLNQSDINAFALPDGHLVIYSGLIANAENEREFAGVIGHELAHIQLHHVMKKLLKEVGLSVLLSVTTGNAGEVAKETAKTLSSSAFDRQLEQIADLKSVDYLVAAQINPTDFANFLYRLAESDDVTSEYLTWMSTHPESKARAAEIINYSKGKVKSSGAVLKPGTWDRVRQALEK